ncbi:5-formyltetrahydrofolate cyclo-ligase [Cytophaga aurantiaca]|uniref:5-formyltetrahydrofolate cyclo-ligase n=1 Tax=Cytophaga aurantiaca TaxID=29530 RepID=UPI0003784301|nr:5-formyltetrahydrofolate cyclo-ligase [Cytophaga aurantiaca]
MNKETARKIYIAKRNELSADEIQAKSKLIAETFIGSDLWKDAKFIHIFISIPNKGEIDTSFLLNFFLKQHPEIKICTSIVHANGQDLLHTCITSETTYLPNKWNIPEPVERLEVDEKNIDLVLLPLLAFDTKGNRVGYGKGFYDRFLRKCKPDVVKVGLSLFEPTKDLIDADAWDVPLDWVLTPEQIYGFN